MALTITPGMMQMEVCVNDIASRIIESEVGPVLNLAVSMKLPISELLQALQQLQQKSGMITTAKAKVNSDSKELAPAMQPGLVGSLRSPNDASTGQAPGSPKTRPAEEPKVAPAVASPPGLTSRAAEATWDSEISDLQAADGRASRGTWEPIPSSKKWTLAEEKKTLLETLKARRVKCPSLEKKVPSIAETDLQGLEARASEAFEAHKKFFAEPRPTISEATAASSSDDFRGRAEPSSSDAAKDDQAASRQPPSESPPSPPLGAAGAPMPDAGPPGLSPPHHTAVKTSPVKGGMTEHEKAEGKECKQQ